MANNQAGVPQKLKKEQGLGRVSRARRKEVREQMKRSGEISCAVSSQSLGVSTEIM